MASALPKGVRNGLDVIARDLLADPSATRVVVALVDCSRTTVDHDTGEEIPTARIVAIEAITGPVRSVVEAALHDAYDARLHPTEALAFNPVTGEVAG